MGSQAEQIQRWEAHSVCDSISEEWFLASQGSYMQKFVTLSQFNTRSLPAPGSLSGQVMSKQEADTFQSCPETLPHLSLLHRLHLKDLHIPRDILWVFSYSKWSAQSVCFPVCFQCLHRCPGPLLWLGCGDEEVHQPGGESEHDAVGAEHLHLSGRCPPCPASKSVNDRKQTHRDSLSKWINPLLQTQSQAVFSKPVLFLACRRTTHGALPHFTLIWNTYDSTVLLSIRFWFL